MPFPVSPALMPGVYSFREHITLHTNTFSSVACSDARASCSWNTNKKKKIAKSAPLFLCDKSHCRADFCHCRADFWEFVFCSDAPGARVRYRARRSRCVPLPFVGTLDAHLSETASPTPAVAATPAPVYTQTHTHTCCIYTHIYKYMHTWCKSIRNTYIHKHNINNTHTHTEIHT